MKNIQLPNNTSISIEPISPINIEDHTTVIIFLHEALGSIPQWKSFPQDLCNSIGLSGIIYERQGHGTSSGLNGYRDERYLHNYAFEELPSLLDIILPPEKKVLLVGHSDGATIALLYAAKYSKKVLGIVSMAAHVIVEKETLAGIRPAIEAFESKKLEGLRKFHGDKTNELFYAWANTWNLPEFKTWNICKDIHGVTAPTLIIQGEKDQYGTEEQVKLIANSISGNSTTLMIDKCGHIPHLEQGTKVISEINNWYYKLSFNE